MPNMIDHVSYLSEEIGPRPGGTEEEQQAALYIAEQLQKEAGLSTSIEDFKIGNDSEMPLLICGAVTLLFAILAIAAPAMVVPGLIVSAISAALFAAEAFDMPVLSKLLGKGVSQNVVAHYDPGIDSQGAGSRSRKIVLVAHYDSGKVKAELTSPLQPFLAIIQWVALGGFIAVPVFLLIRAASGAQGGAATVLNILIAIGAILAILPALQALLHRTAPFNAGANCNASGTAVLMEAATRVGRGTSASTQLAGDAKVHGEQAARAAGLIPDGVEVSYQAQASEPASAEDRLAAAKAAVAALSGRPIAGAAESFDIADNLVQVKPSQVDAPTSQELHDFRQETRAAFEPATGQVASQMANQAAQVAADTAAGAAGDAAQAAQAAAGTEPFRGAAVASSAEEAFADERDGLAAAAGTEGDALAGAVAAGADAASGLAEDAASGASAAASSVADGAAGLASGLAASAASAFQGQPNEPSVPDWFKKAQQNAKQGSKRNDSADPDASKYRSRYAAALDAAVSASTAHFQEANDVVMSETEQRLQAMRDSIMEVKAPGFDRTSIASQSQPESATQLETEAAPATQSEPEAAPAAQPESKDASEARPEPGETPESLRGGDPRAARSSEASPQVESGSEPEATPAAETVVAAPDAASEAQPEPEETPQVEAESEPKESPEANTSASDAYDPEKFATCAMTPIDVSALREEMAAAEESGASPFVSNVAADAIRAAAEVQAGEVQPTGSQPAVELKKQNAPLAEAAEGARGRSSRRLRAQIPSVSALDDVADQGSAHPASVAPGLLRSTLPSLSGTITAAPAAADAAVSDAASSGVISQVGSFVPASATGSFAPVDEELFGSVDNPEDIYVDDADDSAFEGTVTETGAFAGPGYVDMPKSRIRRFFDRFHIGKKDDYDEGTPQEWLDVDDDFEAREVGRARGGWESFRDDEAQGAYEAAPSDSSTPAYGTGYAAAPSAGYASASGEADYAAGAGAGSTQAASAGSALSYGSFAAPAVESASGPEPEPVVESAAERIARGRRRRAAVEAAAAAAAAPAEPEEAPEAAAPVVEPEAIPQVEPVGAALGLSAEPEETPQPEPVGAAQGQPAEPEAEPEAAPAVEREESFPADPAPAPADETVAFAPVDAEPDDASPKGGDSADADDFAYEDDDYYGDEPEEGGFVPIENIGSFDAFGARGFQEYSGDYDGIDGMDGEALDDGFDDEEEDAWNGGAFSRVSMGNANLRSGEEFADAPALEEAPAPTNELEQVYRFHNPDITTEVWFVALGADDPGQSGMRAFLAEHAQDLRGAVVIELDGVGAGELSLVESEGSYRKLGTTARIKRYIRKAQSICGLKTGAIRLDGAESAATVAARAGLQSMHLVGADGGRVAFRGAEDDTFDKVSEETLEANADFVMELLKNI